MKRIPAVHSDGNYVKSIRHQVLCDCGCGQLLDLAALAEFTRIFLDLADEIPEDRKNDTDVT